jgi:ribonuclease VapC
LIVVDTSCLVAIAQGEPDRRLYQQALADADEACLSPVTFMETGILLISRRLVTDVAGVESWLNALQVERRDDVELSSLALSAYLRFGKGFHPARLNLADCFSYALAKRLDAPLLYKGDDFARTDVRSAL